MAALLAPCLLAIALTAQTGPIDAKTLMGMLDSLQPQLAV